jgi:acetyltransferase-like isoleucine patch superfamily enzyme
MRRRVREATACLRGFESTHNRRARLYSGARLTVEPGGRLDIAGQLRLGVTWPGGRYYDSHAIVRRGATLRVSGLMAIHTEFRIWVNDGATLSLASGYINDGLNLSCFEAITIGDDCAIAAHVTMRDSDNHLLSGAEPGPAAITIGDHVWIGMNATILKGVHIGSGAVVAAGAVVARDVEERTLVGGVPARVIRDDVKWE